MDMSVIARGAGVLAALFLLPAGSASYAAPVLSEFVARPAAGEGEWIEIRNAGSDPVVLTGWIVRDATGRNRTLPESPPVPPDGYLLLADRPDSLRAAFALPPETPVVRPSGWPALNDHDAAPGSPADRIVLCRPGGEPEDSVAYFESWLPPERGRSLERVDPGAPGNEAGSWGWSVHAEGATPGRANSLSPPSGEERGDLRGPRTVAPARKPEVFGFQYPEPGILALWLVARDGRAVAVLRPRAPAPAVGAWVWGADAPIPPRSGPYLICTRWQSESGGSVRTACRSVWVER